MPTRSQAKASARPETKAVRQHDTQLHRAELRVEGEFGPGVAGQVIGVALMYDVIDTYGTVFARGCAKRSIDSKVAARKVPLLLDHEWETEYHVGTVVTMTETDTGLLMTADVLDTEEGRKCRDYVRTVLAAGAYVGLSIGFVPRRSEMVTVDGRAVERFLEIELREVSLTPLPSVPGTDVVAARSDTAKTQPQPQIIPAAEPSTRTDDELLTIAATTALTAMSVTQRTAVLSRFLAEILSSRTAGGCACGTGASAPTRSTSAAPADPEPVTASPPVPMAERLAALRQSYRI